MDTGKGVCYNNLIIGAYNWRKKGRSFVKYIPNALSITRIFLIIAFIIVAILDSALAPVAMILFLIAGLTDMLDGPIARYTNTATELGAVLDSVADHFMILVAVFVLVPAVGLWSFLIPTIWVALASKLISLIPALIKHRQIFFIHTTLSKTAAVLLLLGAVIHFSLHSFVSPQLAVDVLNIYLLIMIFIVFINSIEEILIIINLDYPEKNPKTIFNVKKLNSDYQAKQAN